MKHVGRLLLSVIVTATALVAAPDVAKAMVVPNVDALWATTVVPDVPNWPDARPVELGVKFVTSENISIVGVRFYKGNLNTGTHSGSLWDANGTLLAHATFTNETGDGWQDVLFTTPVAMTPNDLYIASYYVPVGYYSAVNDYFATAHSSGPVTALSSVEADGNGVYTYGAATGFPVSTYLSSNYWVTPLWNKSPVVNAGVATSGNEGSAIALSGTATDPDGDSVTTTWSVSSGPDDGGSCTFADSHALATTITCNDNGTVVATLTAADGLSVPTSKSVTITVGNVAPTVVLSAGDGAPIPVGQSLSVSGVVTDPGSNDSQTCTVTWGDGTLPQNQGCSSFAHAYAASGVYNATVTIVDDDGGSSTAALSVVVYDPTAGFVTAGGWFTSPAGAYLAGPDLTGKATFGFTSEYKKGATVPTGNTEFQFSAGGIKFHSSNYNWLVVTGGTSANFKGTGSLNGIDGYKFLIWASDSSPDTIRIKIWSDTAQGELVVYDNGTEQALGGGQVIVHVKK